MDHILRTAVKGVAGGIGLASEGVTAYKSRRRSKHGDARHAGVESHDNSPGRHNNNHEAAWENRDQDRDEEQWELDEAQDEIINSSSPEREREPIRDISQLADTFIRNHPPPPSPSSSSSPSPSLPFPVVLPQRRPKDRSRGFIRAYAPVLEDCGIDQPTFLEFLETFNRASLASPWLQAINLAAIGTMFLPHGVAIAVSIAVKMATRVAIEAQSRIRTNTFLDKVNDGFFRPRGLYCLVMTWNPESDEMHTSVDLASAISASQLDPAESGIRQKIRHNLRASSGDTYGDLEFPETAPLIFPGLDYLAAQTDEGAAETRSNLKKGREFVEDYLDRRAQAKFASKHPDNTLSKGPKPTFTSRYADPDHPASSGSLISLVTGGYINPPPLGGGMGGRGLGRGFGDGESGRGGLLGRGIGGGAPGRGLGGGGRSSGRREQGLGALGALGGGLRKSLGQESRDSQGGRLGAGFGGSSPGRGIAGGNPGLGRLGGNCGPLGGIKKMLKKNVLYLMIVNMPTEQEMAEAQQAVAELVKLKEDR
ncbi:hypothetical protein VTN00DRAFT_68 [Thermoascus crustaceus]|uniref:uncharacterized protein n=1 Tax=Thermoascus crustaceus TaxID=5088 RepID=UPI0037426B9C